MRIILIGASIATLAAAASLRRNAHEADIIFINRTERFVPHAIVSDLISGEKHEHEVSINLSVFCAARSIRLIIGDVTHIDHDTHALIVRKGEHEQRIAFDRAIIDLPSEPRALHAAHNAAVMALSGGASAHAIRAHLIKELQRVRASLGGPHNAFITVGGGRAGVETACAIEQLTRHVSDEYCVFPEETKHILIEHHDVDDALPPRVERAVNRTLDEKRIKRYPEDHTGFTSSGVLVHDQELETNTIIWTATRQGNRILPALGIECDEYGFAVVSETLQTNNPHITAIGESIRAIGTKTLGRRDAHALVHEGIAAARNTLASIRGQRPTPHHPIIEPSRPVAIGGGRAVTTFGPLTFRGASIAAHRHRHFGRALDNAHKA